MLDEMILALNFSTIPLPVVTMPDDLKRRVVYVDFVKPLTIMAPSESNSTHS